MTSYKGGVGKTSMALSIAYYYLLQGKKVVLIDTNPQNSNVAEDVFSYFHVQHAASGKGKGEDYIVYTMSPTSDVTFTVYNATDSDPFELAHVIQSRNDPETIYIIDTNKHIRSAPDKIFSKDAPHQVFTWFLWGWSSARLDHQLEAILDATERLEESWMKSQVVHVFNLYDFFVSGLSIRKASTTLKPLKNVLTAINKKMKEFAKGKCVPTYIDSVVLLSFARDIHSTLARFVAPDDQSMDELPTLWANHLMSLVESTGDGFPYNILLVPTFFKELTMSMDRLIISAPRSFKKLIEQIKPMSEFIGIFLEALHICNGENVCKASLNVPEKQKKRKQKRKPK